MQPSVVKERSLADEVAAHNRTLGREKQQTRRKGVAKTEAKLDALAAYRERFTPVGRGAQAAH